MHTAGRSPVSECNNLRGNIAGGVFALGIIVAFFTSSIPPSSITNPVALAFNELQDVDTSVEVFSHHMY